MRTASVPLNCNSSFKCILFAGSPYKKPYFPELVFAPVEARHRHTLTGSRRGSLLNARTWSALCEPRSVRGRFCRVRGAVGAASSASAWAERVRRRLSSAAPAGPVAEPGEPGGPGRAQPLLASRRGQTQNGTVLFASCWDGPFMCLMRLISPSALL